MLINKSLKKLKSNAGESLTETLVALLIAALALVMLAGAISSSLSVITVGKNKLDTYYNKNENLATMTTATGSISNGITITEKSGAVKEANYSIDYYKNDEFTKNPVISYKKQVSP